MPEESNPQLNDAIRLLRAHLSETYRLHRRILRNRRKQIKFLTSTFANWGERCVRIRDLARAILVGRREFVDSKNNAIARAEVEDEVRYAQLATRIQSLDGAEAEAEQSLLAFETKLHAALYRGIADPSIKVDVVGVVFLSRLAFARIEDSIEASA